MKQREIYEVFASTYVITLKWNIFPKRFYLKRSMSSTASSRDRKRNVYEKSGYSSNIRHHQIEV